MQSIKALVATWALVAQVLQLSTVIHGVEVTVTLPEFFNVTEGDTFQVCASVNEGDVILMFTLTPDSEFAREDDIFINESTVTFDSELNTTCITIEVVDDEIAEGVELFNLTAMTNDTLDTLHGTAVIEIAANDGAIISLPVNVVSLIEGENSTSNSLCLNMSAEREVPVMLRVMLRSAFSDENDIQAVTTPTSFFPAQVMCLSVLLEAIDDQIVEDTEIFDVVVEAVNPFDSTSSQNTSTVYIFDSDGVEVTLPAFVNAAEGDAFKVCASVGAIYPMRERDVILMFTLTPDSMFANENDTRIINESMLIIFPQSATACITIKAVDDQIAEGAEVFVLNAVVNNILDAVNGTTNIEITDNDGVEVTLREFANSTEGDTLEVCASVYPMRERDVILMFTLTPDSMFARETDVRIIESTLIIGPQSATACITIEAVDDEIAEGAELFNLTAMANNTLDAVNGITVIEIPANDGIIISLPSNAVNLTEGENNTSVSLHLNMPAEREVPVMLRIMLRSAFSNESDIRSVTTPMSFFPPHEMYLPILIEAIDDQIAEDNEVFDVVVEAVNPFDSVSTQNTSTVYIFDNDGVQLFSDPDMLNVTEGEGQQICVTIEDNNPARERSVRVTFELYPMDTSDANISPTNAEIPVGNSSVCIFIEANNDQIAEDDESVQVIVTPDNSFDVVNQNITLLIIDNDGVVLVLTLRDVSITEGDMREICVEFAEGQIPAERIVMLSVSESSNQMELNVSNGLIFITPGDNSTCFDIEAIDDTRIEDTEVVNVTVMPLNPNDSVMDGTISATITDNDMVELMIVDDTLMVTEGETAFVCVNITNSQQQREIDIILTYSVTVGNNFTRESSDFEITNDTTFVITPEVSQVCLLFITTDDNTFEDPEEVTVVIEISDQIIGNTTIIIIDNDGVMVMVPDFMEVMEGDEFELCVNLSSPGSFERDVTLTFDLIPINAFARELDLVLINDSVITLSNVSVLAPPQVCVMIDATDDQIVEGTESFNFIVTSSNPLDIISGNTTIDIIDNDGVNVTLPEFSNSTEGDTFEVCASVGAVYPMRERDVILEFALTPDSMFARENDTRIINETTLIIDPQSDSACITIEAVDDQIAEETELFNLTAMANDTLDVVNGTTSIEIEDNDGIKLTVSPENINLIEGQMSQQLCVSVDEGQLAHERSIYLDFSVMAGNMYTDENDYNISADSAVIEVGRNMVCIGVQAVDDILIENQENITITANSNNTFDRVSGSTAVTIMDNDGATLNLINSSSISLIEGNTLSLCVALEENEVSLLRRTVKVSISSSLTSINDQAITSLQHNAYLMFTQDSSNIMCTPLSIDIDMVYSVNRTFIVRFEPSNALDSFSGVNYTNVAILDNGLQFLNIMDLDGTMQLESQSDDEFSDPIYARDGIPIGTSLETVAYVGENGFISFRQGHFFSRPQLLPSASIAVRDALMVAPYWSNVDIRLQGRIYYRLIEAGRITEDLDMALLNFVSGFIAAKQNDTAANFSATTMLVAQWRDVPPYLNGDGAEGLSPSEAEFINRTNSFQGVVVTDGQQTFVVFTYNRNMLEWSGPSDDAVIGVNIGVGIPRNFPPFQNHPLSGRPEVPMVASLNLDRGIPWADIMYKIGDVSQNELDRNRAACLELYNQDIKQFGRMRVLPAPQPCPCSLFQALRDQRFTLSPIQFRPSIMCFVKRFGPFQECCYDMSGALLTPLNTVNGEAGSLLRFSPLFQRTEYLALDAAFRTTCCENSDLCDLYYERRPSDDCSRYSSPRRCWGFGDPHFTTLDDRGYTFNGLGEYTLIRIGNESMREFELQGRTALVSGSMATQFSAFAFGIPSQVVIEIRITENGYLEVLLNGSIITDEITNSSSNLNDFVDIQRTSEMNTIESTFSNGISITVTLLSGLLNAIAVLPQDFMGLTQGLLGNFNGNAADDFIYPNGTMLDNDASDRMIHDFGLTWQITDEISLFTYPGGLSVANFSFPGHLPRFLDEVLANATDDTRNICGNNDECIFDATETGSMDIGLETRQTNQDNNNDQMVASNMPPQLGGNDTFMITVGQPSTYTFTVMDDSDSVMPVIEGGLPANANLTNEGSMYTLTWFLMSSDLVNFNRTIRITARDSLNASSLLVPQLQVCACSSTGGNCTLDGLINIVANPLILTCQCGLAYTGRFCDEDLDGCTELTCFTGVECMDIPAPGIRATCGLCPSGYRGDGLNCIDIDECTMSTDNCEQMCVNIPGGFTCACSQGFALVNATHCIDVNECETLNGGCQQTCNNTIGSFMCSCTEGYELQMDNITCQVLPDNVCSNETVCEQNCVRLNVTDEVCSCNIGFTLAEDDESCSDMDECAVSTRICDQICNNTNGSFVCDCYKGFRLGPDERSCIDIDECLLAALRGEQPCMISMMCENTNGSFDCVCPPGSEPFNNGTMCREVCGENFYRLPNNQCSRCPENSVRPLTDSESMCSCELGYRRRQENEIEQPCIPHLGFVNTRLTFLEMNEANSVSIPLYLSANSSRAIAITFTVTPTMYMNLTQSQVVFPPGTRMQNLIVNIPGNVAPTDGTIRFSISINEGSEFILSGLIDNTPYYDTVEVTIIEDDQLPPVLESNSLLITLPDLTATTFTSDMKQQFRVTTADVINRYCRTESCQRIRISESRRKRQSPVMVTVNDITLRDIRDNDQNQLQFSMFVQTNAGQDVLLADTVQRAILQSGDTFEMSGFTQLRIGPLIEPTTQPPVPTTRPLSDGAIAGIAIGAIVGVILLVLLIIFIIVIVRRYRHSQKFVLNTYGYQVQRKPKGPSIRQSYRDESEQTLDVQTMKDNDKEPIVSVPMSTLVEKECEEEAEIFTNKAASESEKGVSLSEDIAKELGEGQETQVLRMSFDEPGEETKL